MHQKQKKMVTQLWFGSNEALASLDSLNEALGDLLETGNSLQGESSGNY
jgi:hypothetical protein